MTTAKANIKIAIVGGGLGGLASSIVLGRAGYDVHLFEQASEFSQLGVGIGIGPNAIKALHLMNMGEEYKNVAEMHPPGSIFMQFFKWDDNRELATVMNTAPGHSTVHRKRVLEALVQVLPLSVTKHFNSRITELHQVPDRDGQSSRVRLHVSSGRRDGNPDLPSEKWLFDADAVIGSDGVHSIIRDKIGLSSDDPNGPGYIRYTGIYAYRTLVNFDAAVKQVGDALYEENVWSGPDRHILTYPVEGETLLNVVAFVSDRSQPPDQRFWTGPWTKAVDQNTLLNDFAGFGEKPLSILKLVENPTQWALHELVSLDKWTVGRVTLLGDSCHASLPHNGGGAGQAIEDAYVLGELLKMPECTAKTLPRFLQAYEDARRERAIGQQNHSRETGEIYQFAAPGMTGGRDVNELATRMKSQYDWLWNHDLRDDVRLAQQRLASEGVLSDVRGREDRSEAPVVSARL